MHRQHKEQAQFCAEHLDDQEPRSYNTVSVDPHVHYHGAQHKLLEIQVQDREKRPTKDTAAYFRGYFCGACHHHGRQQVYQEEDVHLFLYCEGNRSTFTLSSVWW